MPEMAAICMPHNIAVALAAPFVAGNAASAFAIAVATGTGDFMK
jgi:hypothetical protein